MATQETKIKVTADTKQAERAIANLESALEGISSVADAAGVALGAISVAAVGVSVAFKSVVDNIGGLADLGKALNISAQSLDALQKSAQLAGINSGELNAALFRLQNSLGEVITKGSGPAKDALDRLGVSARELSRIPADQQIARITSELLKVQNPAERSALAIDLLGKQGPRMLEVADNAARLAAQAERMGIALSDVDVRNLEIAGDALDELAFIAGDTLDKAMAQLAPYIIALANSIKDSIEEAGGLGTIIIDRVIPALRIATQAAGALATIFIVGKITAAIIAAVTAMIKMYQAIKLATTAAAALNAVLGKNPILKIVGAIAGLVGAAVVIDEIGEAFDSLDQQARAISTNTAQTLAAEKEARSQVVEEVNKLNEAEKKALDSLNETLAKLEQSVQFERDKAQLGERQANINKMIAEESDKLAKVGLTLSDQAKERIRAAYTSLEALKQEAAFTKTLEGIETERLGLIVADKNEREIVLAIRKQELEFGRSLNAEEQTRLSTAIKLTQQAREQAAVAEAINDYTREQTKLEKINRGLNLQKTLGGGLAGGVTSEREYQRDQEALQTLLDNKLISEQQYYQQREELARAYNLKIQDLELQRIERVLMAERGSMATVMSDKDRAVLQRVGENERQKAIVDERIKFEKKSELEKTQFVLEQGASIFNALGAQNKRAFEAAKAFNIANAIMNTYMAATKALATYPFPFGAIAAAGAVAMGLAQVAQIRSQQYSGRALGGPVMGGQTYMVGESGPELFTPSTTGSITRNGDLPDGKTVNVNFTIVANDTTGFDQLLVSRKGIIQQVISDAMLEKGRRSMV